MHMHTCSRLTRRGSARTVGQLGHLERESEVGHRLERPAPVHSRTSKTRTGTDRQDSTDRQACVLCAFMFLLANIIIVGVEKEIYGDYFLVPVMPIC